MQSYRIASVLLSFLVTNGGTEIIWNLWVLLYSWGQKALDPYSSPSAEMSAVKLQSESSKNSEATRRLTIQPVSHFNSFDFNYIYRL